MGDGGVACVPLQHIMDRFSNCGGKNGKLNSSESLKFTDQKMKMKPKRGELEKSELGGKCHKEAENGQICREKVAKEEVEEGELGTLKWPRAEVENGEFIPERTRKFEIKSEIEKGETVADKWRKGEVEKGEFVARKWRKGEVEKREFNSGRLRNDDASDRTEIAPWRVKKDELEKGEFIPGRWRKTNDYSHSKVRRHDHPKNKGWKYENERTPPPGKYSGEKEFSRSGGQHSKWASSRWETSQERPPRISSKIVDEEGNLKTELSNGKNHGREHSSGSRLKRHVADSDSINNNKHHYEFGNNSSSKSRRLSDDSNRSAYSDHYSRHSVERSYRNPSSFRNISSDRYSSRHNESSLSSRAVHDRRNSSPRHSERSPRDRTRYHDHRDRSPIRRHRNRSPSYLDRSPHDQDRYHDTRNRSPNILDRSPLDRCRQKDHHEGGGKTGSCEKRQSQSDKGQEEKSLILGKDSEETKKLDNGSEKDANKEEKSQSPRVNCKESPQANGFIEELLSMEEDMDICDTPPHVPMVADSSMGKWFYLDDFGLEQGPSRLGDIKTLVEEGYLVSDHLIKHLDCDRWVTVENAVSPLITSNFQSVVSDTVTQLVSPPEAPGNVLVDNGDIAPASFPDPLVCSPDSSSSENFHIDERVGAMFEGFAAIPGKELEAVGEVLQMTFEHGDWERWKTFEGVTWQQTHTGEAYDQTNGGIIPRVSEFASKETSESVLAPSDKDNSIACGDPSEWFYDGWSCKGGDWKRDDEIGQDKSWKKKIVLNDGYPLCQMPGSRCEDPRLNLKEELYYPSHSKRLDLPAWAFSSSDEWTDSVSRSGPIKPLVRGLKGSILPVVRINACVVKDHGSFVSESRVKIKKERSTLRSTRPYSTTSDAKRSSDEGISRLRHMHDKDSHGSSKSTASFRIPKDRICTIDDLQLHFGGWYYLDGAGHEQGPLSFAEMRVLADQGIIPNHSSAFRKLDKVWVPVTSTAEASEEAAKPERENSTALSDISGASLIELRGSAPSGSGSKSSSFHSLHPQFLGYTRGKLHELVMKSYKSREFAAAINEVLDPWINARQPKKEIEKHMYNHTADSKFQKSDQSRAGKRARLLADESDEEYEMEDDIPTVKKDGYLFDDICGDATFSKDANAVSEVEKGHWGLLDGRVLARVFHFLNVDIKSFVNASLACKHWRTVVSVYKDISRQLDLSAVAASCTDSTIWSMLNGYNKEKITSLLLRSCTGITPSKLEEILRLFPSISFIDIRGCSQLEDLPAKFPNINWVKSRGSHLKVRSLSEITETALSVSKTYNGLGSQMDGSSGLRDYLESSNKRDSANQLFRRSLYKRSKLFDARKSSSILSRDAHLRRWAIKKSENGYKRMEEFLASSLKDIMKENTFDFFVPKVAEIEDRVKSGYYAGHGLNSLKEDISRMCRDAIKTKNRSDSRDMNHIISLFIRLATSLDGSSKYSYDRHDMLKTLKNISPPGFSSSSTKYKKNIHKVTDRKHMNRSDVSSVVNSSSDYGDYASDREIRRRLSKLNKKSSNYGSETCNDRSSGETVTDSDSTSDTGSDSDIRSEAGTAVKADSRGDAAYFRVDDGLDTLADDREWGARMTKLSLVPPVTRKYEVIDHYVIVADEEEVRRKMQVSLPDDYAEKLCAQKNGTEESDMEIPEVKDFKPRKQLGDEVIEQEVYGIDPYTHNLLLDSMPDESDWSLLDKHLFIEDELLCTLNKRVRHFTNTGNTPMVFPLKPVVEHILKTAEEEHNKRTMRLCQFMLKAIDGRPEDKYVAYRKGLGVVCNKEGGFGEDDFVVEFLGEVYPAWKWFEKQDGIRSLQKNSNEPAPEFYNIYLERPKGDADGYDLVVVDAMHKANYASRICHSCRPNCEAKVTSVDGHYQIGIYSVRPIRYGEEITFDYNSVTESKEEYEASVCLCGSQVCRGSYLNLTGEDAFQMVLKECHGVLDRHRLLLEACEVNSVSEEDYIDLGKAGLGSCLLGGLPDWLIAYSARLVRFINFERTKLPEEILRHNLEEKRKYFADICLEVEKSDAEVQAEGVYNQRLQNLALTLDKVRYVIRCVFGDPKKAHPPLEKLSPEGAVSYIWKGEGSLVEELIQCIAPHMEDGLLNDLKSKVRAHDPSGSDDISKELRKSLIWLRDEIRNLPCTYKCRHDAAADLIHLYAYTKCFFRVREYKAVTSPPVYISPLDLGPKYADKLGLGSHEFRKTYGENYCLGQLIYWHNQANAEPDCTLDRASRGCLSLPDVASFYAKVQKPSRQRVYGPRTVKFMLARMEKQRQRPWPKDRIWSFKNHQKIFGSPMLDSVLDNGPLSREMTYWLKHRPSIFQAMWDR